MVIFDGVGEGLHTQNRAVEFVFWEAAEIVLYLFGGDFLGFADGFAFGEFTKGRGGCDGGGAAVGFPFDISNDIVCFFRQNLARRRGVLGPVSLLPHFG